MKFKSVITTLAVGCVLVISGAKVGGAEELPKFRDIKGSFAEQAIISLAEQKLIRGVSAQQFAPAGEITRLHFACLLAKTLGVQPFFPTEPTFSDLPANTVETGYVEAMVKLGIIKGQEANRFGGDSNLERQDAAVLLAKALAMPTEESDAQESMSLEAYKDKPQIASYALASITSLTSKGWLKGKGGYFYPTRKLTRGEAAVLVDCLLETVKSGNNPLAVKYTVTRTANAQPQPTQVPQQRMAVTYQVVAEQSDDLFQQTERKYYPGPPEGLAGTSDTWTGFLRQQGRDIIVDLGELKNISSLSLEFMQHARQGVYLPKHLQGAVSADGVAWYQLGNASHEIATSDKNVQNVKLSLSFPALTTRYIKLSFPVEVWALARHLTVNAGIPGETPVLLAPASNGGKDEAYLQDRDIKDILLVYTGNQSEQHTYTGNDFLPLVAYVSPQVKLQGEMFDTMLFLPYLNMPCTKEAWTAYLDDLFTPARQLSALEATMTRLNTITGSRKKEKVILTLPYPDSRQEAFDRNITFSATYVGAEQAAKNRLKAVQSFYGEMMKKWQEADFQHLELAGIYWYEESINYANYQEPNLVQKVASLVQDNGQKFFWIPYYGASGYADWKFLGFTHVFLQPNYYATQTPPLARMTGAANLAKRYNTGIQIELDNRVFGNPVFTELFYQELNRAKQLGLNGDTVTAYHVGTKGTIIDSAYSNFPEMRRIYDDLYKFISGT